MFFNGNTFADVGRQIVAAIFADLPRARLREVTSAIAHCIADVLDHDSMARIVNELCAAADLQPGDRVKTLRGSMKGVVLSVLTDGRIVWRSDTGAELTALPESLLKM